MATTHLSSRKVNLLKLCPSLILNHLLFFRFPVKVSDSIKTVFWAEFPRTEAHLSWHCPVRVFRDSAVSQSPETVLAPILFQAKASLLPGMIIYQRSLHLLIFVPRICATTRGLVCVCSCFIYALGQKRSKQLTQSTAELCTLIPLAVHSHCILQGQGLCVILSQWLLYILG